MLQLLLTGVEDSDSDGEAAAAPTGVENSEAVALSGDEDSLSKTPSSAEDSGAVAAPTGVAGCDAASVEGSDAAVCAGAKRETMEGAAFPWCLLAYPSFPSASSSAAADPEDVPQPPSKRQVELENKGSKRKRGGKNQQYFKRKYGQKPLSWSSFNPFKSQTLPVAKKALWICGTQYYASYFIE